jgi:predicted PurR-regulated permease PerM
MEQIVFYKRIYVGALALLTLLAIAWLIGALQPILLPFIIGIIIAYLFDPLADRLEAKGCSRALATTIITVLFFSLFSVGLVALGPLLLGQLADLVQAIPGWVQQGRSWLAEQGDVWFQQWSGFAPDGLKADANNIASNMGKEATQAALGLVKRLVASATTLLNVISLLCITPLVTFYLLRDWDRMVARVNGLLPRAYAHDIRTQFCAIDATLAGYLRGQLQVMAVLAVFYAVTLTALSLPYALIIALITAVLIIIPYIGTILSAGLALVVAYAHYPELSGVLYVGLVYAAGQVLESNILSPKLIGDEVGLHPLWIVFGLLAGGALFGFVGVLLAVPITAVIGVLVRYLVARYEAEQANA